MDYQRILTTAEATLKNEYEYIVRDIKECISSGSTGGEISSIVGKYLKDLRSKNPHAYYLLEKDIQVYLAECKKQGLQII